MLREWRLYLCVELLGVALSVAPRGREKGVLAASLKPFFEYMLKEMKHNAV